MADATIDALDSTDAVVATTKTDGAGVFTLTLPPGSYTIVGRPMDGLMGSPPPVEVTVGAEPLDIGALAYDTGIR